MKNRLVTTLLIMAVAAGSFFLGSMGKVNTNSDEFRNDYLNMSEVVDFETTENGIMLYTNDGSGYYWER